MFGPSKISKSLIDAVNKVMEDKGVDETQPTLLDEASEKVPTPTGMKVYGHRYGDSAKARRDQTKSSVDTLKGPKAKDMKEEEELAEDGDCVTKPQAKDIAKKEVKGHEKKMHEEEDDKGVMSFKDRLLERAMTDAESKKKEKIVMSMKDKQSYFKKKYGKRWKEVMYATATKKAMSEEMVAEEEIELDEVAKNTDIADKKEKMARLSNTGKGKPLHNVAKGLKAFLQGKKEPMESVEVDGEILETATTSGVVHPEKKTVDMLRGRVKVSSKYDDAKEHKSSKINLAQEEAEEHESYGSNKEKETKAIKSIKAHDGLPAKVDNLDPKHGKPDAFAVHVEAKDPETSDAFGGQANFATNGQTSSDEPKKKELSEVSVDEKVIAGVGGWVKSPGKDGVVTDKSGAKHTPMSRAKDLARQAFKKVKNETLGIAPNNQTGV
mgnify:CR=1 FL=1